MRTLPEIGNQQSSPIRTAVDHGKRARVAADEAPKRGYSMRHVAACSARPEPGQAAANGNSA